MVQKSLGILVLVTLVASGALAQGTVTDGALEFTFNSDIAGPTAGNANLLWEGVDQLFQSWWWYRIAGDTFETPLPVPDSQDYTSPWVTLEWTDVDGRGFDVRVQAWVADCRNPGSCFDVGEGAYGLVLFYVQVDNPNPSPLEIELFAYNDLDVAGSAGTDSAERQPFFNTNNIVVSDGATDVGFYSNPETQYQVTPWQDLRTELNDTDVDNLDGSGLPFASGDFTGAYQFSLSIPANDLTILTTGLYVNFPFFASGFDIGSTAGWASP